MLKNPSFEGASGSGEWTRDTHTSVEYGEIFVPEHWIAWWEEDRYRRPEMKVIPRQPPFLDPLRIHEGLWAFQSFTMFGRQHAGLYQVVEGLTPGAQYRFVAHAHAWSAHIGELDVADGHCSAGVGCGPVYLTETPPLNGDPLNDAIGNFAFSVGVGPSQPNPFADDIQWGPTAHIYNEYHEIPSIEFAAPESGSVTIYLRAQSLWEFRTSDAYFDDACLVAVDQERGQPRVQYERTYVLLPPNESSAMIAGMLPVWNDHRFTIGGSADDSGIGDLDYRRVIAINPDQWTDSLEEFFTEHYPGGRDGSLPCLATTVGDKLREVFEATPPPPPPPPPPTRETRGHVGLHLQTMEGGWEEFAQMQPSVMKVLSMHDVIGVKRASPHTTVVFRHFTNDYGDTLENPDPHKGARNWIDKFRDSLYEVTDRLVGEGLDPCFYVESLNEVYPSLNLEAVVRATDFDIAFCEELHALDLPVRPAVFCTAVGNPHESEYEFLVPLAEKCEEVGGMMGYHGYWLANADYGGPDHLWKYLAGRWAEMDKVFVSHGIHVKWYGGEGGGVGGISGEDNLYAQPGGFYYRGVASYLIPVDSEFVPQWVHLLPHDGWKSPECYDGNWSRYLTDIMQMDGIIRSWNETHDDRYLGFVLFTTGADYVGWPTFQIRENEMRAIRDAILGVYDD